MRRLFLTPYTFSHGKKAWFQSHINDPYVKKANQSNYRSRAAFKLKQILEKHKFQVDKVLDLGCSPGSWCQVAQQHFPKAQVIGIDLLQTKTIAGVEIHQGDARSLNFHQYLKQKNILFDLIISDMAPNFTGDLNSTHEQILQLNLLCLGLSAELGAPSCNLIMKTTYGRLERNMFTLNKELFQNVSRIKPDSSRSNSVEFFYLCQRMKKEYQKPCMLTKLQDIDLEKIKTKNDPSQILSIE